MFSLVDQADAILAKLAEVQGLSQIDIGEVVDSLESKPRALPSVSLLPPVGKPKKPENAITDADSSWMVVIVAKSVLGPLGHLAMMDKVMDTLAGFKPEVQGAMPLILAGWGLLEERIGEAGLFASHVTFTTTQRATIRWNVRNNQ